MDGQKYEIIFVNDFATPLLSAAFDAVSSYENLSAKRLDSLEIMNRYPTKVPKRVSFVLCRFEGDCFEHLRSIGAAIYGPQIILHYVRENKALPKVSHPLYSTALMGTIATVTSVTGSEREYLFNSIQMLHGEASRDLFDGVNVVITPKVGSKKYLVGANRGLHLLLPSWITEAWRLSAIQDPIDMMLPVYTERFRVPVFCQLVICVSGLSSEERKEVSDLVVKHGGRYSGMMKIGETTHLIIKQATGLKYSHAKKWKLQIVSLRWLIDSVSKGYALDEEDYRVPEDTQSSTPTTESNKYSLSFHNISAISRASVAKTHINETHADCVQADDFLKSRCLPDHSKILSGCMISFIGCTPEETDRYTRIVRDLGGHLCCMVQDQVSESLTHFVVGSAGQNFLDANRDKDVIYVTGEWLLDCEKSVRRVPESNYLFSSTDVTKDDAATLVDLLPPPVDTEDLQLINQYFGSDGLAAEDDFMSLAPDRTGVDTAPFTNIANNEPSDSVHIKSLPHKLGIFSNFKFVLHPDLTVRQRDDVQAVVEDEGGRVVEVLISADFIVVPYIVTSIPTVPNSCKLVTPHWIDQCLTDSKVNLDYVNTGKGFTPLVRNPPLPLSACVISLSGFIGKERSFLTTYAQALGAVVQDCFLRKSVPTRKLLASTHLVAAKRDGRKWPAAQSWNLPAVNKDWLFACAEKWERVREIDFPVPVNSEPVESKDPPPPNLLSEVCKVGDSSESKKMIMPTEMNRPQAHTESVTLRTPEWLCNNRPSDPNNISRDSIGRLLRPSPPLSEQVARCLKKAVHTTSILPKRKLDLSEDDSFDSSPLQGVVICVAKHLSARQVELNGKAKQLGGDFKWIYDPQICTHLIAKNQSPGRASYCPGSRESVENQDPTTVTGQSTTSSTLYSDVSAAKEDGKVVVHPDWLDACLAASRRLPEDGFPPLATEAAQSSMSTPAEVVNEPAKKLPRIVSSDLLGDVNRRLEQVLGSKSSSDPQLAGHDGLQSPLMDISNSTSGQDKTRFLSNGPGARRLRRNPRRTTNQVTTDSSSNVPDSSRDATDASVDALGVPDTTTERTQPGQSCNVRWRYEDAPPHSPNAATFPKSPVPTNVNQAGESNAPNDFIAPNNAVAIPVVQKPSDTSLSTNEKSADEKPTNEQTAMQRVFSFSGLSPDARDHYASVVNQLGGDVDNQLTISDSTTHLIVHTPTRSEKYLICLATGKWILHKSYLDACLRELRWVEESNFEWGGPGTEPLLMQLSPAPLGPLPSKPNPQRQQAAQIRELAKAARYWRLAGGKAFQNWRVIFGPGCDKETSFRRVIQAGGGQVLTNGPPYPPVATVTHAFYKKKPNVSDRSNQLPHEYGWLRIDYLSAYLVTGHEVSREDFEL